MKIKNIVYQRFIQVCMGKKTIFPSQNIKKNDHKINNKIINVVATK